MILILDRRQRKREQGSILRFQQQQKVQQEAEIRQRERFNNWAEESAKHQILLLESIMATLDTEKVDEFKAHVGTRYTKEISDDMNELEKLLDQKQQEGGTNPELEADIESKINEIESGKGFIAHLLPQDTINQIQRIADSAKQAYKSIREIPEIISDATSKMNANTEPNNVTVSSDSKLHEGEYRLTQEELKEIQTSEDHISEYKKERASFAEKINQSLSQALENMKQEILSEVKENEGSIEIADSGNSQNKVMDAVRSTLKDLGLDSLVKKKTKTEESE